jgi:hypothetical protein
MNAPNHRQIRILAAILLIVLGGLVETWAGQAYCQSEFHKYYQGLGATEARVNPMERFLFSVLLTQTKTGLPIARAANRGQTTVALTPSSS